MNKQITYSDGVYMDKDGYLIIFTPYDATKYIKVVCRLCGSEWLYPKQYEKEFDAEHPLENCAYCKHNQMFKLRNT